MSICRRNTLKCPDCGNKIETEIFDSINAQVNPEWREALLQGKIHVLKCPICQKTVNIDKSLLYHDMENEFMVWYYPFESLKEQGFLDQFSDNGNLDLSTGLADHETANYYKDVHYVFSMNELVRYILFREKLAESKEIVIKGEYAQ